MLDQRTEALESRFNVSSTWEQPESWQTEGIIPTEMPPGFFILLEPPLQDSAPGHFLVGLNAVVFDEAGVETALRHYVWQLDNRGRIVLYCRIEDACHPAIGSTVRFVEQNQEAQQ